MLLPQDEAFATPAEHEMWALLMTKGRCRSLQESVFLQLTKNRMSCVPQGLELGSSAVSYLAQGGGGGGGGGGASSALADAAVGFGESPPPPLPDSHHQSEPARLQAEATVAALSLLTLLIAGWSFAASNKARDMYADSSCLARGKKGKLESFGGWP